MKVFWPLAPATVACGRDRQPASWKIQRTLVGLLFLTNLCHGFLSGLFDLILWKQTGRPGFGIREASWKCATSQLSNLWNLRNLAPNALGPAPGGSGDWCRPGYGPGEWWEVISFDTASPCCHHTLVWGCTYLSWAPKTPCKAALHDWDGRLRLRMYHFSMFY